MASSPSRASQHDRELEEGLAIPTMITLVDNTIPVAADFNTNYTNLNNAVGSSTAITAYVAGDILYASATNTLSRLTAGANRQKLTLASGIPAWDSNIPFLAAQSASADANTLDDYEESSWTPTLTFATPGDLSVVYSIQLGRYTKIGRHIVLHFALTTTTFTHTTASGALTLGGLPFTAATVANFNWVGSTSWRGITKASYTAVVPVVASAGTTGFFLASGSGQASSTVVAADVPTGGTLEFFGQIAYNDV